MFRHPRIERGNSGHGRPGDKTQPASTSRDLFAYISYDTLDSGYYGSHDVPASPIESIEAIEAPSHIEDLPNGIFNSVPGEDNGSFSYFDPADYMDSYLTHPDPTPNDRFVGHDNHCPFTDSGYASGPTEAATAVGPSYQPLQVPGDPDDSNIAAQRSIIDVDAKTLYSAATSLDPVCSRRYIQELSQDLYRNLQAQPTPPDWSSISQVLPDLIKTFATKIGQGGDSPVHLNIMYFIHRRHRYVRWSSECFFLHFRPELTDTTS